MSFERSVFINCPFDKEYLPLLRSLLFTVLRLGLKPRLALESSDAAEPRIEKIIRIIAESKFGIHDLSRCQALKKGQMFRLNMPLELGLDIGCRRFQTGRWQRKRCLILETEKFRYHEAISDLSSSDLFAHADDPEQLVSGGARLAGAGSRGAAAQRLRDLRRVFSISPRPTTPACAPKGTGWAKSMRCRSWS